MTKETVKKQLFCLLLHSLKAAAKQQNLIDMDEAISALGIDLRNQYTFSRTMDDYTERKLKNEHAFQVCFTIDAIEDMIDRKAISTDYLSLVDIGDSAGTHLAYLRYFLRDRLKIIDAVSINLDPVAVNKIDSRGGKAVLCRAEDYRPDRPISLYLSYEMIEHLHNPALFLHNMAMANNSQYMVFTVPYVKNSRVSLIYLKDGSTEERHAEEVHIFELCPEDWEKIALHSGWKLISKKIYLQYPKRHILSPLYRWLWNKFDFEGFLAMYLVRDMTQAERYMDWEE